MATAKPKPETRRQNHGNGHSYFVDGQKVKGVTTIIRDGVPKGNALTDWAARTVAGYAVDHWDELGGKTPSTRLKELEKAHYADRDAAGRLGTKVHKLAEELSSTGKAAFDPRFAGHVDAYLRFLAEWGPEDMILEGVVVSRKHAYMGTFDAIATLPRLGRTLYDVKTGRSGVFGEVALQLAGYRYAETYLDGDLVEHPMPEVDGTAVLWIRPDSYQLVPVIAEPRQFRQFLYAQQVAGFVEEARDLVGEALYPEAP